MSSEEEEPVAWLRAQIAWWLDYARENAARRPINPMRSHEMRGLLARCEAELAILDEHGPYELGRENYCSACGDVPQVAYPCRTVRLLASGYKHRPGFPAALAVG